MGTVAFFCNCSSFLSSDINGFLIQELGFHDLDKYTQWRQSAENRVSGLSYYRSSSYHYNHDTGGLFIAGAGPVVLKYTDSRIVEVIPPLDAPTLIFIHGPMADLLPSLHQSAVSNSNDGAETENEPGDCLLDVDYSNVQRTCMRPSSDLDWDGVSDGNDDDQDGDGKLDVSELTDTMVGNDVETVNSSVITVPDPLTSHRLFFDSNGTSLTIEFDYKVSLSELLVHVPLVAYFNEDGTERPVEDYDTNLNSETELNRLEDQLCHSPNLGELMNNENRFPLWIENLSLNIESEEVSLHCEWLERRSISYTQLSFILDDMEIANWKETIRYTVTIDDMGPDMDEISAQLPLIETTTGKVWYVSSHELTPILYFPWVESLNIVFSVPPVILDNETQLPQDDNLRRTRFFLYQPTGGV